MAVNCRWECVRTNVSAPLRSARRAILASQQGPSQLSRPIRQSRKQDMAVSIRCSPMEEVKSEEVDTARSPVVHLSFDIHIHGTVMPLPSDRWGVVVSLCCVRWGVVCYSFYRSDPKMEHVSRLSSRVHKANCVPARLCLITFTFCNFIYRVQDNFSSEPYWVSRGAPTISCSQDLILGWDHSVKVRCSSFNGCVFEAEDS